MRLSDSNDHRPVFESPEYQFKQSEGWYDTDTVVGRLTASDQDSGQNAEITYTLVTQTQGRAYSGCGGNKRILCGEWFFVTVYQ